jgi:hypothetical protein
MEKRRRELRAAARGEALPHEWIEHLNLSIGYEGIGELAEAFSAHQKTVRVVSDGDENALAHLYLFPRLLVPVSLCHAAGGVLAGHNSRPSREMKRAEKCTNSAFPDRKLITL